MRRVCLLLRGRFFDGCSCSHCCPPLLLMHLLMLLLSLLLLLLLPLLLPLPRWVQDQEATGQRGLVHGHAQSWQSRHWQALEPPQCRQGPCRLAARVVPCTHLQLGAIRQARGALQSQAVLLRGGRGRAGPGGQGAAWVGMRRGLGG